MYIDSHCHITCDELYENLDSILQNARKQDVQQMLVMCTSPEELERALELKKQHPDRIRVAFGWFPEEASQMTDEKYAYLKEKSMSGDLDVLGEIGLDYYWDKTHKEEQKELFKNQLEIASEAGLPVSIHMRDASRDTLDLLKKYARTKILFHCFSGSKEIMQEALHLNSLISFAGPITFKNNKSGPENVKACPIDRLLSETDSPYLAPVPVRGKRNEPAYVAYTVQKIAELKDLPLEQVQEQIAANYQNLFK